MVWLTWRQHRIQVLIAVAFLVVVGGLLLFHGLRSADLAVGAGQRDVRFDQFVQVSRLLIWAIAPPALVGLFWGAPVLAREYERGTNRLAWTQSVTRRGWLGVKLVGLGAAVTAAGLVFGLVMSTWADGFADLRLAAPLANQDLFVATGVVPAAWWLFTFMVGVAAGAVTRKLLPAMAVTLAVFFVAYVGMFASQARLDYATPARLVVAAPEMHGEQLSINTEPGAEAQLPAGALMVHSGWLDRNGVELTADTKWNCASTSADYLKCMRDNGFRWFADYHPADRYWRFQWTEAGLLAVATLALGALAWYRVR